MAMAPWRIDVTDIFGNLQTDVQVEAILFSNGEPAEMYDASEVSLGSNFSQTSGMVQVHFPGGVYAITVTANGETRTFSPVYVGTAQGADVGVLSLAGFTFTLESGTAPPPGSNAVRCNNADLSAGDKLYFADTHLGGSDASARIQNLAAGDEVILTDPATGADASFTVDSVTDESGYSTIDYTVHTGATTLPFGSVKANFLKNGPQGDDGIDGASNYFRVDALDAAEGDPTTEYEAGDSVGGVTLVENMTVLRATDGGDPTDGVWVVPASGAASRHTGFAAFNDHPGCKFSVIAGSGKGAEYRCTSDKDGTLDATDLVFAEVLGEPDSSETVKGIIEIATNAEVIAGSDTERAVTPASMKAGFNASGNPPLFATRTFVNFNGVGTPAIRSSGNVTSITDLGVGLYRVNFTTAFSDTNYSVMVHASLYAAPERDYYPIKVVSKAVDSISVRVVREQSGNGIAADADADEINVWII